MFCSKYQRGFRKGFSTQHDLLITIEKMKNARYNKEFCVTTHRSIERF